MDMMLRVAYYTLGCKVNQYETERIRESLENAGLATVAFGSPADVCVINTCTVTHTADSKSRSAVRKAHHASPGACVVVTGCYSQLEPGQFGIMEGVDLVVDNSHKDAIPELIQARLGLAARTTETDHTVKPRVRTRAIVKVQDGCDHFCAYCVVPYARPGKVSRPLGEVTSELEFLARAGYKEIVLTGIRLGSYDDGGTRLPDLIAAACKVPGVERVRLSSIEPWEVDDLLLQAMAHPKVCRHLHIPLQSGDDGILRAMGRPYTSRQYMDLAMKVRQALPGIGITTDVIVGFPGETDGAFANTAEVVTAAEFSRLHVFRYSPRPRTRAQQMPDQIDAQTKKERADILWGMGKTAVHRFAQSLVGHTVEVLVENRHRAIKHLRGYADNYAEVVFAGSDRLCGAIVPVRITSVDEEGRACGDAECTVWDAKTADAAVFRGGKNLG